MINTKWVIGAHNLKYLKFAPTQLVITMQKLGFSLKANLTNHQFNDICKRAGCKLAGVWIEGASDVEEFDDLLSVCDMLLVDCSNEQKFDIVSKSIKKGVVPIIRSIDGLSTSALTQLQQLANEIGIRIGFVELGYPLNGFYFPVEVPIIVHLKHYLKKTISELVFHQHLIRDIASVMKFSKLDVRKVRAYGLPICADMPQSLMIMVDFNNNSVFTCNIQLTDIEQQACIEIFNGEASQVVDTSNSKSLVENVASAISDIANNSKTANTIELALETSKLVDVILSKINP